MKYFVLFGDREDELDNIEFTDITKATTWINEHFDDFSIIRVIKGVELEINRTISIRETES